MARESTPIHLRPHAPVAERVLCPGDPGRAMRLATALTESPKMVNHHRGLWGYTGVAADGEPLTVQATGMGGPSAAIVVEELIDLGARRIVRVGTCGALTDGFSLGEVVVVSRVLAADGASVALGAPPVDPASPVSPASPAVLPDAALTAALKGGREVVAVSTDLFYDPDPSRLPQADVVEMEAATVLTVCARRGVAAACVLVVSDLLAGGARRRISPEALAEAELRMGEVAFAGVSH